ncbi:hypothetical protein [Dyadobacter frigoris]|uniref:Uncharacterized protein n=1 Tax=Dyadobacter frigoris TaxID=2576211 RepID=A0A4V6BIR5_9BACT|nr:hypothetical protein [Dyadobacter frigoris]TKT90653.1 hypothetical protein FDK13_20250 [Dyadobacter frigoris]GLU51194.1 hypothetical protein Dfri01_06550 [Dyadobacter frigoris]
MAEFSGGNFWNGAAQAGIIAGFNHAAHRLLDNPEYDFNGNTYTSKAELYAAILADQSMEQFGIKDIIALGGTVSGMELVDKRFVAKGASSKTSILSENLRKVGLGSFKKAKWAPTLNNVLSKTASKAAFIARWIPWISTAMLAYDTGMILYNTQLIYNKITANGR